MLISYDKVIKQIERLEKEREKLTEQINECPAGELTCARNGKGYKWYVFKKGKTEYLPKVNEKLAIQLAVKKYLQLKLRDNEIEVSGLKKYLKSIEKITTYKLNSSSFFYNSEYARLVEDHYEPLNPQLEKWKNEKYEKCLRNPEHLVIKGTEGRMLRSKSEALIDLLLYTNRIPFRYEDRLVLEGMMIYPDFTIRHPKTGDTIVWEHFGMMDNPAYAEKAFEKLKLYARNGYILSINLIATFETTDSPLSTEEASWYIDKYLS